MHRPASIRLAFCAAERARRFHIHSSPRSAIDKVEHQRVVDLLRHTAKVVRVALPELEFHPLAEGVIHPVVIADDDTRTISMSRSSSVKFRS